MKMLVIRKKGSSEKEFFSQWVYNLELDMYIVQPLMMNKCISIMFSKELKSYVRVDTEEEYEISFES